MALKITHVLIFIKPTEAVEATEMSSSEITLEV